MQNNICMRVKGTVAIPTGVHSEGEGGGSSAAALKRKTSQVGLGALAQEDQHSINDEGSHRQRAINKRKIKAHAHDHSGATFLDDGKSGKSTRAARESSMIAVIGKLAPPEPTPLDVAYKRRAQLLDEDQVLLQNLALALQDEEEQLEDEEEQGCRKKLLSSLKHTDGTGSMHDGDSTSEDSQ